MIQEAVVVVHVREKNSENWRRLEMNVTVDTMSNRSLMDTPVDLRKTLVLRAWKRQYRDKYELYAIINFSCSLK